MADQGKTPTDATEAMGAERGNRPWESVRLRYVGHISEIIKGGGGKLTIAGGDPGEGKKQSGGGMG